MYLEKTKVRRLAPIGVVMLFCSVGNSGEPIFKLLYCFASKKIQLFNRHLTAILEIEFTALILVFLFLLLKIS